MPNAKILTLPKTDKDGQLKIRSQSATHAVMEMYGTIGQDWFGDGVSSKDVVNQLKELPSSIKKLTLHINSPGGSVTEGMAIYNRLKQYGQNVEIVARIDSLSASIASIIMLAAHKVEMGEAGLVMIHKPWNYTVGNADEHEKMIQLLDEVENQMVSIYSKKTGLSRLEIQNLLREETWLGADDALEMGFIDEKIEDEVRMAACALDKATWLKSKIPDQLITQNTVIKSKVESLLEKANEFLKK